MTTDEIRFWSRVDVCSDPLACWPWTACTNRDGYGQIRVGGRLQRANRIAYLFATGVSPDGLCVRHKCDNPRCCNPFHLELGTQADNVRDMHERGRARSRGHLPRRCDNENFIPLEAA